MDFKKERNQVEGGGCYKVTLVLERLYKKHLLYIYIVVRTAFRGEIASQLSLGVQSA